MQRMSSSGSDRQEALDLIQRDPMSAAETWAYHRLASRHDAMYEIAPKALLVLFLVISAVVAVAAGVLHGDFGENLFKLGVAPFLALVGTALTLVVKDRDERRALTQQAAKIPGLVHLDGAREGELNEFGRAIATGYAQIVAALEPSGDPVAAIKQLAGDSLKALAPPASPAGLPTGGATDATDAHG